MQSNLRTSGLQIIYPKYNIFLCRPQFFKKNLLELGELEQFV